MKEQNESNHKESLDKSKRNLVLVRLAQLNTLDLDALRAEWPKYNNGDPAPNYRRKQLLSKLTWRVQEIYYGGHSEAMQTHLQQLAQKDPLCVLGIKRPLPLAMPNRGVVVGTRIVRYWRQNRYEVIALEKGFEYENKVYRSLSAIAEIITGSHWNGRTFFGLNKSETPEED